MKNFFLKNSFLQNLFLISLVFFTQAIKSGPYCWDYQENRWLRKQPFTPVKNCLCNCAQEYQTTDFDKKGRKCTNCGHKLVFSSGPIEESKKTKEKEQLRLKVNKLLQELEDFSNTAKNVTNVN